MLKKISCLAVAFLALPFSGCWDFEFLSWSPDGRYLVFIDPSEQVAWRWDTLKQRPEKVPGLDGAEIRRFAHVSNQEAIALGGNFNVSALFARDVHGLVKVDISGGGVFEIPPGSNAEWFAVSPDGAQIVTIGPEGDDEDRKYIVAVAPRDDLLNRRILAEFSEETVTPALDHTGSRLLLTKGLADDELPEGVEEGAEILLLEFGADTVTTKSLLKSVREFPVNPRWVDDNSFVFLRLREDSENEENNVSALMYASLDGGEPELLHEPVLGYFPATISPDQSTIVCTGTSDLERSMDQFADVSVQLLAIDVATRAKTILTNEPFGAYAAVFHPTANRIAYVTGEDPLSVRILDLDTGERQLVWRNEEERLFTAAERLMEAGEFGLALASFEALLRDFPDTPFRTRIAYYKMNIHLDSRLNEFDEAVEAFEWLKNSELRPQATELLWKNVDVEAIDPSNDLIRTYGTEASRAAFEHDTDRTRDLTRLAVRATRERIYFNVGFDSAYDLGGSVFQDFVLLIHEVGRDTGVNAVTPNVNWEFPATRTIIVRHWFENGKVYDLEILDANGTPFSRFTGSGFAPPSFPLFDVFSMQEDADGSSGSISCWIDRDALALRSDTDYVVQVCTMKGGIESYKGVERPREESGWDIADAFGEANTRERIDAEIAAGTTPVLRGYAATLRISEENQNPSR